MAGLLCPALRGHCAVQPNAVPLLQRRAWIGHARGRAAAPVGKGARLRRGEGKRANVGREKVSLKDVGVEFGPVSCVHSEPSAFPVGSRAWFVSREETLFGSNHLALFEKETKCE
jgi:hypothetical protein